MISSRTNPKVRDIVQRLLSIETAERNLSITIISPAFLVSDKLRRQLSTWIGSAGFRALLIRALTLARSEAPCLDGVHVNEDGSLEGLSGEETEAGAVLIAHLVGLLETFIGEPLTLQLLSEIWPELTGVDMNSREKESI